MLDKITYTDADGIERNALAFLITDADTGEPTGHLHCPCSRYGRTGEDCAPVAIALALVYRDSSGDALSADDLDGAMSLVVNDADGVAELLVDHAHALPAGVTVADLLDEDVIVDARERVRAAYGE